MSTLLGFCLIISTFLQLAASEGTNTKDNRNEPSTIATRQLNNPPIQSVIPSNINLPQQPGLMSSSIPLVSNPMLPTNQPILSGNPALQQPNLNQPLGIYPTDQFQSQFQPPSQYNPTNQIPSQMYPQQNIYPQQNAYPQIPNRGGAPFSDYHTPLNDQFVPNMQGNPQIPYSPQYPGSNYQQQNPNLNPGASFGTNPPVSGTRPQDPEMNTPLPNVVSQLLSMLYNPNTRPQAIDVLNNLQNAFSNPTSVKLLEGLLSRLSQAQYDPKSLQDILNALSNIPKSLPFESFRNNLYSGNIIPQQESILDDIKQNKIGSIIHFIKDVAAAKSRAIDRFFGNMPFLGPLAKTGTQMVDQGMNAIGNAVNPYLNLNGAVPIQPQG